MPPVSSLSRPCLFLSLALLTAACGDVTGALGAFEDDSNLVHIFTTHHATPQDGTFPNRGDEDQPRVFENDLGWEVHLSKAYVVTTSLQLVGCTGQINPLDMYWGHCPESMSEPDLDTITVAGQTVDGGNYCQLIVSYGPYDPEVPGVGETKHPAPKDPEIVGSTILLGGYAINEAGDRVEFELYSDVEMDVTLDLSALDGGAPIRVEKENFPEELTVSKTYDRFFDGVDFNAFDPTAHEAMLPNILAEQTFVSPGTLVKTD